MFRGREIDPDAWVPGNEPVEHKAGWATEWAKMCRRTEEPVIRDGIQHRIVHPVPLYQLRRPSVWR
jgi:hypothetical protein